MTDNKTIDETLIKEAIHNEAGKKNIILDSQLLGTLTSCGRLFDFRFNHNFQANGGKSNSLECKSTSTSFSSKRRQWQRDS